MTVSFGIGTTFALFQTSGTNPRFGDTLKISVIAETNSAAYVFQNQCGRSSGPDDECFCFLKKLYTSLVESKGILVPADIDILEVSIYFIRI